MKRQKYLNFPIQLLRGYMTDSKSTLNNILYYAVYEKALKLHNGDLNENIKESANFYGITLANTNSAMYEGEALYNDMCTDSPKVGLSLPIFWDFYQNNKTEFEKICLLGFLAIKSILGNKSYCKANNFYLWARMDGKIKSVSDASELSIAIRKFANEYQTKKIKTKLREDWGLKHYSRHTKGFFISYKMTLKDLILEVEKQRQAYKDKCFKEQQKVLVKQALDYLKTPRTPDL